MSAGPRACPACGGGRLAERATLAEWRAGLAQGRRTELAEQLRALPDGAAFLACADCGFCWLHPAPPPDRLRAFYQDYGFSRAYAGKAKSKLFRARNRLLLLLPQLLWRRPRRLLDVGCNLGYAVEAGRQLGFRSTGLELDGVAAAEARRRFPRNEFLVGGPEELAAAGRRFELVYSSETIEHVPDPAGFARALAGLLAPGGLLFLTTPDGAPYRDRAAFLAWPEVRPPEHLCWFTRASLRSLLAGAGFERIRFRWLRAKAGLRVVARRGMVPA